MNVLTPTIQIQDKEMKPNVEEYTEFRNLSKGEKFSLPILMKRGYQGKWKKMEIHQTVETFRPYTTMLTILSGTF